MTAVTVVLIDRDLLFSRGLELLLERVSGGAVRVVGHTTDGRCAVEVVRRQRPDVAIVGLSLPAPGALPVIRDLKRLYPYVRVIAMGGPGEGAGGGDADTNGAVAALRAGADGLIDTTAPPETLLAPLRATAAGMSVVPPAVMAALVDAPARRDRERVGCLSAEERRLWRLVHEPSLRNDPIDPDMLHAHQMGQAVRRDIHKMKAFVRFREVDVGAAQPLQVAWHEPAHHILQAAAPWFARRMPQARWVIFTPDRSVECDGRKLHFGPALARAEAPAPDAPDADWLAAYRRVFGERAIAVNDALGPSA